MIKAIIGEYYFSSTRIDDTVYLYMCLD